MSNQSIALIQLVSDQTMQNLVPLLALRPKRTFHLTTVRTGPRSVQITGAAARVGVATTVENIRLTEMPSIPETARAVSRAIHAAKDAGETPVVNFTGGTKLMSIGAYQAAKQEQVTSCYVDTDHQQFQDGFSGPPLGALLEDDLSFTSLHHALTVSTVAIANGREHVTDGRDWMNFVRLAMYLLRNPEDEKGTLASIHSQSGLFPKGEPRDAAGWLAALDKPIHLPIEVGKLAVEAGLLRSQAKDLFLPDSTRELLEAIAAAAPDQKHAKFYLAVGPLQETTSFLTGGWWEVAVVDAAHRSGRFRDIRWGAHVRHGMGFDAEEDILAMDGVQVAYFSCKRGGSKARLVSALDELDTRARAIGGNFVHRFLAVYSPIQPRLLEQVEKRADELGGVRILTPESLHSPAVFSSR